MITNALDKNLGIEVLEKAIVKIQETIQKTGGDCIVKMKVCFRRIIFIEQFQIVFYWVCFRVA